MAQGTIYKKSRVNFVNYNVGQVSGYSVLARYGHIRQWICDDAKLPSSGTFTWPTLEYGDRPVTSFAHSAFRVGSTWNLFWIRAGGTAGFAGLTTTTAGLLVCGTLTWIANGDY